MTDPTKAIDIFGSRVVVPSTARIVTLVYTYTGSTPATLEEAGVDYIVPASKKFWLIGARSYATTNGQGIKTIKKHTVVDTDAGTAVATFVEGANSLLMETYWGMGVSIETGKYLNIIPPASHAGTIILVGLELDV